MASTSLPGVCTQGGYINVSESQPTFIGDATDTFARIGFYSQVLFLAESANAFEKGVIKDVFFFKDSGTTMMCLELRNVPRHIIGDDSVELQSLSFEWSFWGSADAKTSVEPMTPSSSFVQQVVVNGASTHDLDPSARARELLVNAKDMIIQITIPMTGLSMACAEVRMRTQEKKAVNIDLQLAVSGEIVRSNNSTPFSFHVACPTKVHISSRNMCKLVQRLQGQSLKLFFSQSEKSRAGQRKLVVGEESSAPSANKATKPVADTSVDHSVVDTSVVGPGVVDTTVVDPGVVDSSDDVEASVQNVLRAIDALLDSVSDDLSTFAKVADRIGGRIGVRVKEQMHKATIGM